MPKNSFAAMLCAVLIACTAIPYGNGDGGSEPEFTVEVPEVDPPVIEEPELEWPVVPVPPALTDYRVRIEFVFFSDETDAYPTILEGFKEALAEWQALVPIETVVSIAQQDPIFPMAYKGRLGKPGVISVHITDLQQYKWADDDLVGAWMHGVYKLWLDADFLSDPEFPWRARGVAMHELGHVFGLPHITTQRSLGKVQTGDITIPSADQPQLYLMYPKASPRNIRAVPSELEVNLAIHHILHDLTEPQSRGSDYFCLTDH